jgi:polysaccharide deacetylase family protein (PEP-CTERM system associated)
LTAKERGDYMTNKMNILQIDVENWYSDLDIKDWGKYEDRIVQNTSRVLEILKQRKIRATFFILGHVAEQHPELVQKIIEENHEIGSHGYSHTPITQQTPDQFKEDLLRSIKVIEKISGEKVLGYRAPLFTIVEKTSWALDIIKNAGLKYDSSIFPVKTPLYGVPDAPLFPYYISSSNIKRNAYTEDLLEIPLSVYRIPLLKRNIPIAGGFYLRFLPYKFISYGIQKINRENFPAVCYIHPWELDPKHPRIRSLKWYHYYRLNATESKFMKLLRDFKFTSSRAWINLEGN